jgi:hypothetical protein
MQLVTTTAIPMFATRFSRRRTWAFRGLSVRIVRSVNFTPRGGHRGYRTWLVEVVDGPPVRLGERFYIPREHIHDLLPKRPRLIQQ